MTRSAVRARVDAAGAVRDRHEGRLEGPQRPHGLEQLLHAGVVAGGKNSNEKHGREAAISSLTFTPCRLMHAPEAPRARARHTRPMQTADLVIDNLASIATPAVEHRTAAIAVGGGRILAAGPREEVLRAARPGAGATVIDGRGMSAIPGLVDCHTHTVWAGSRVDEFDRRAQGQPYEQIAAAGGGIKATVAAVRAASEDELVAAATRRLARMRALGTTTAEVKSGYGLDAVSEATMLRAAHAAGAAAGVRITGTCLALHALPPEAASAEAFVRTAIDEILPACADLATAADCFLERGAFSADECRPVPRRGARPRPRAADPRRPVLRVRRDPARRRAGCGLR